LLALVLRDAGWIARIYANDSIDVLSTLYHTLTMKKIILTLLSFGSLLTSCSKSADKTPINVSTVSGTYTLKDLRMAATGVPEQDAYNTVKDCEKDDLYQFKSDSSFTHVDNGMVCDSSNGNYEGTWRLDGDTISFYGQTGTITKFDGNTMEITATSSDSVTTYMVKSTFEKQ